MNPRIKHLIFDYPLIISSLLLATVFTCWASVAGLMTKEFLFPAVGAVLGLSYFILKQHLEETRLFKELFTEFNDRYDKQNEHLYKILSEPNETPLEPDDVMVLYDYFNLCAEEYLFYRKGFIHPAVWRAWINGMKIFYADARVRVEWQKELKTDSYYGFEAKWLEE
jgi:hypothetical protein